jgi:predicted DNA-binding protein
MSVIKIQTGLRLDEETYEKLKAISISENRSLNNLVEFIVKKYLIDYEKQHGTISLDLYQEN